MQSLLGDPAKAREKLGWTPEIPFTDMVKEMVLHDLSLAKRDKLCNDHGYDVYDSHD